MHICMASDFFYPNTGGVESHILHLSKCLIDLGHKVIVITHSYNEAVGVQYLNGVKVYYLPFLLFPGQNIIWPLVFHTFPLVRQILLGEHINVVHGHSAFSPMAHEVMFHARTLGINTVFTDHSLLTMNDVGTIILNEVVKLSLIQCNHIICVSRIGKQSTALTVNAPVTAIPISVIPNAVDARKFIPDPSQRDSDKITIIVNSRLVHRKGVDLLAAVIPKICIYNPKVFFIIAGDGPKRKILVETIERYNLHDRVTLLGTVPHDKVRDVLVRGDIFLNTSLTEAFCIAIVEAASCGLQIVSTNVGGIPEVLPPELINLTDPNIDAIFDGVRKAIGNIDNKNFVRPSDAHAIIDRTYRWDEVARKTESVYFSTLQQTPYSLKDRLKLYKKCGSLTSLLFIILTLLNHLLLIVFDWF